VGKPTVLKVAGRKKRHTKKDAGTKTGVEKTHGDAGIITNHERCGLEQLENYQRVEH